MPRPVAELVELLKDRAFMRPGFVYVKSHLLKHITAAELESLVASGHLYLNAEDAPMGGYEFRPYPRNSHAP